jgi:hypothetical protein
MNQGKVNNTGVSEAADLALAITRVAERATNEEELRIGVEKLLEPTLQRLGISVQPRYERRIRRTILTAPGRADALYGQAIIEYEPPGKLSTEKGLSSTQEQLERYLLGLAGSGSQREATLRRLAGIGFDGHSIFFLRYRGDRPRAVEEVSPKLQSTQLPLLSEEAPKGTFSVAGPYTITEVSIAEFLLHLRALRRRPLVAEELAKEFGPAGEVAHKMVNSLYNRLTDCLTTPESPFPRVEMLYEEWKRIFGIVYGQELVKAESDARALARLYHITEFTDLKPLLFAVHTYYALFMKLLAAELLSLQQGALLASIAEQLPGLSGELLQSRVEELEKGTWFESQGIRNFLEADFFGWYLSVWNIDIEQSIRSLARALAEYEPATATLAPEATRDLLKKLYQDVVPQELRHDLGEYYTPDWLAELLLNEMGYMGNPDHRLLDPACGSGTFLVLVIRRILDHAQDSLAWRARGERELVSQILENVVGFDLNPLAVITARTNYLLALGPLARHLAGKDIPVYLCDSILTPQTQWHLQRPIEHQQDIPVPSTQKEFWIPKELVDKGQVNTLCRLLEQCIDRDYRVEEFVALGQRELRWENPLTGDSLVKLYEKVLQLKAYKRNGLWARIIKNAFAPVFRSAILFDYIVGNPPWVNWESLATEYRDATRELWQKYGLFSLKGHAARLGGGKKDVAMLMLYAAMDSYLKNGGKLGFVITQTVFKTKGAGDGFRRFQLGDGGKLKVLRVNDLVELQPFEGASNRTSTVILEKGKATDYPVTYTLWKKTKPGRIGVDLDLVDVEKCTRRISLSAEPVNNEERTSPWLTVNPVAIVGLRKIIGPSTYKAYSGACTWLNAVYWLEVTEWHSDGKLVVRNRWDIGRAKARQTEGIIESDLLYPLLRGRDVTRWRAFPSEYILLTQDPETRTGIDETVLKTQFPDTYAFLWKFRAELLARSGYRKFFSQLDAPFYTMYNVGPYTMAPYKVGWAREDVSLRCSVFSQAPFGTSSKLVIPDQTVQFISFSKKPEAHFVCAVLNSAPSVLLPLGYTTDITTHIVKVIAVPRFDATNPLHTDISNLSQRAHQLAAFGQSSEKELHQVEEEINRKAAELWGLTEEELEDIQAALREIS